MSLLYKWSTITWICCSGYSQLLYRWKLATIGREPKKLEGRKGRKGSNAGLISLTRQADLVSPKAQTPSPVIPFPEYIDMMSSPHSDNFTILADAPPVTPAYKNITMWECSKPGCRTSWDIDVLEEKSHSGLGTTHRSIAGCSPDAPGILI